MKRFLPHIAITLFLTQLLLMLVSWLLSAAFPESGIRSLLSSEGLRWFFGHFSHQLATPVLLCLLLVIMAYGVFRRCGALSYKATFRERRALTMTLLAMGTLWPSPFSRALLPMLCFIIISLSAFYGIMAGHFNNLTDVYEALLDGIRQGAAFILFYLLITQLYLSVCYTLPTVIV